MGRNLDNPEILLHYNCTTWILFCCTEEMGWGGGGGRRLACTCKYSTSVHTKNWQVGNFTYHSSSG